MADEVKQNENKIEVVKRSRRSTTSAGEKVNSIGKVRLKRLSEDAILPTRATDGSAGYDLYSTEQFILDQFTWHAFSTGWAIEVPPGYEAQIRSRSGLALQEGTFVLNSPGTIDSDYRGEIKVILYHLGNSDILISPGHRIAQIVFNKVYSGEFDVVEELSDTGRGEGGFGSTGIEPLGI